MKKSLKVFLSLFILISFSCSKENEQNVEQSQRIQNSEVSKFLDNYYKENYTFGKNVTTKIDNEKILVTEVILGSSNSAKGYFVKNVTNNDFLYFIDIDKDKYEMKTFDIKLNEVNLIKNLDKIERFKSGKGFDLISYIKENSSNTSMRFWGWQCGASYSIEPGSCYRNCSYYVLWGNTGTDVYTCSNLPGNNPVLNN
jgi:hypothetical protein